MSYETGLRYPRRFAGLIGISGYVHEPERLLKLASPVFKEQRFLVTHGSNDALIPLKLVRPQIDLLIAAGLSVEFHEFTKDHTIIEPELHLVRAWIQTHLPPSSSSSHSSGNKGLESC